MLSYLEINLDNIKGNIESIRGFIDGRARMMAVVRGEEAKLLAQRLVHEELGHKLKLELYYESMFQADD